MDQDSSDSNFESENYWSDSYNYNTVSEVEYLDDTNWVQTPTPYSNTDQEVSKSPIPNTITNWNSGSGSGSSSSSTTTLPPGGRSFNDPNWIFKWTEDLHPSRKRASPSSRRDEDFHHLPNLPPTLHTHAGPDQPNHLRNAHIAHGCTICTRAILQRLLLPATARGQVPSLDCSPSLRDSPSCAVCGMKGVGNWELGRRRINRHYWREHLKRDIRPKGLEDGEVVPMMEEEYLLYLKHFGSEGVRE